MEIQIIIAIILTLILWFIVNKWYNIRDKKLEDYKIFRDAIIVIWSMKDKWQNLEDIAWELLEYIVKTHELHKLKLDKQEEDELYRNNQLQHEYNRYEEEIEDREKIIVKLNNKLERVRLTNNRNNQMKRYRHKLYIKLLNKWTK